MSASSGIGVSAGLVDVFSSAVESNTVRFIKVSIRNESLVHAASVPISGTFDEDLVKLQDTSILDDDVPAYVLTRLDKPEWLAIFYVPDTAKVRDKMLYASTRSSLLKSLGSTLFTDSIFATSKSDLTAEAYANHKKHLAAPKPLSASEQEMEGVRAAERQATGASYQGSGARQNHIGSGVGWKWTEEAEEAVKYLGSGDRYGLVVLTLDVLREALVVHSAGEVVPNDLGSSLPSSDTCYALFARPGTGSSPRQIIFIYSCPSNSAIKHRMVYSSGVWSTYLAAKELLSNFNCVLATKKIETSDPKELDETYMRDKLDQNAGQSISSSGGPTAATGLSDVKKPFAKPRGPARRK